MRILFIGLFIVSASIHAAQDHHRAQIEQRIKPLGQVRLEKDVDDARKQEPAEDIAQVETEEVRKPGQKIYEQYCAICHRGGLAGAPKFRDEADWKRLVGEKSLDELTAVAIKGINAMPPKGTCIECSEADIKAAIEFMLPES